MGAGSPSSCAAAGKLNVDPRAAAPVVDGQRRTQTLSLHYAVAVES